MWSSSLGYNRFGAEGAKALAEAVARNSSLETLEYVYGVGTWAK